jgi:hypothetical protein
MNNLPFTRRDFLYGGAALVGATLLESCTKASDPAPEPVVPTPPAPDPVVPTPPAPTPPSIISTWGDSLTLGTGGTPYPTQLATLYPNRTVVTNGFFAQESTFIAFRMGAIPATFTVDGGVIPASGAVKLVPTRALTALTNLTIPGALAGIAGTLTTDASVNFSFTRTVAGVATPVSGNASYVATYTDADIFVFWPGQNDDRTAAANATVLANIAAMVARINGKKFIVMTVLGADAGSKGSSGYNQLLALNNAIVAAYPANSIDIRAALIAAYNPTIAQDVMDHTNDIVSSSLRSDSIHLNTAGYAIVAREVKKFIDAKGW